MYRKIIFFHNKLTNKQKSNVIRYIGALVVSTLDSLKAESQNFLDPVLAKPKS